MAIAANTLALYDFEETAPGEGLKDSTGNAANILTKIGTTPFSTTNGVVNGVYAAGSFASGRWLFNSTVGNSLVGNPVWTAEGNIELQATSNQYFLTLGGTLVDHVAFAIFSGQFHLITDDVIRISTSITPTIGVKYYFAIESTASNNINFYFNVAGQPTALIGNYTAANAGVWPASGQFLIGANSWAPLVFPSTAFQDFYRLSDVVRASLPTDPIDIVINSHGRRGRR